MIALPFSAATPKGAASNGAAAISAKTGKVSANRISQHLGFTRPSYQPATARAIWFDIAVKTISAARENGDFFARAFCEKVCPVHLSNWQWFWLAAAAFCSGLSKTGIAGLGILPVAIFANVLPARESTGALLPLLLCGDVFGVTIYRKHASWPHLWRLFPWVIAGVVGGYFALDRVNNAQIQRIIGVILLAMIVLQWWRARQGNDLAARLPHWLWFGALMGVLAGFNTMVANAAGPVMVLYLLAIGLPKLVFIGTSAWFFLLVNAFKVPFSLKLGLITRDSLLMDAILLLPLIPGALLGPFILKHINQQLFERMVLVLTLVGVVRLLW